MALMSRAAGCVTEGAGDRRRSSRTKTALRSYNFEAP
jgi:hypothetical protein